MRPTIGFLFHNLLMLGQSFLELRLGSQDYIDRAAHVVVPMSHINNSSSCLIPAFTPLRTGRVMVSVSPEDYERLIDLSSSWRVTDSGYVVFGKRIGGRNTITYMHTVVFGGPCTHVNGDRLDNRRCNLTGSKKRRRPTEFTLETILDIVDNPVTYCDGKQYHGDHVDGKPHGFGILVESKKKSIGWWSNGDFDSGIVMYILPVPSVMLSSVQMFHPTKRAILVHNNNSLKTYERSM